jgi:hypothetical protein
LGRRQKQRTRSEETNMSKPPRKLILTRETLAPMQDRELNDVNGGTSPATPTPWCPIIGPVVSASVASYLITCPTLQRRPPEPEPPRPPNLSSEQLGRPRKPRRWWGADD